MTTEEKLKELILSKYGTMTAFSEKCGIKYQTIMSILTRGVNNASVTNIIRICQTLGISTDDLAEGRIIYNSRADSEHFTSLEELTAFIILSMKDNSITFDGKPLSESESQYIADSIEAILYILKGKRARHEE